MAKQLSLQHSVQSFRGHYSSLAIGRALILDPEVLMLDWVNGLNSEPNCPGNRKNYKALNPGVWPQYPDGGTKIAICPIRGRLFYNGSSPLR